MTDTVSLFNTSPYQNIQDIHNVSADIKNGLPNILPHNLIGIYLGGSLSYGGFNLDSSDIDVCVIIKKTPNHSECGQINQFHQQLKERYSNWANRIDCVYIKGDLLKNTFPPEESFLYYACGVFNEETRFNHSWLRYKYLLYHHAIPLLGPKIKELIEPIPMLELQKATIRAAVTDWSSFFTNLKVVDKDHHQANCIKLFSCTLHSIMEGKIGPKNESCEWAKNTFGLPWSKLIQTAENWKYGTKMLLKKETIDYMNFALAEIKKTSLYKELYPSNIF